MKRIVSACLLLFFPLLAALAAAASFTNLQGRPADLLTQTGQGRWTVVMIWAHDCPVCNREVEAWDLFHDAHADTDARVVGLSIDGSPEVARRFVQEHELAFPSLVGSAQAVSRFLRQQTGRGLYGTPTFLLYDPAGKLVGMQVGPLPPDAVEEIMAKHETGHETGG